MIVAALLAELFLLVIGAACVMWALAHVLSDHTDVPFVKTPARLYPMIADALALRDSETVYELGSGDAGFLRWCAARYPKIRFVGIEANPLLSLIARWRARSLANITLIRGNIFETDLHDAQKIYAYLLPDVLERLAPKFEQEFRGTLASRAFHYRTKDATATIRLSKKPGSHRQHMLYLYHF